ncbi:MAG: cation:proton antiporter [Bacteroidales bacterium]|jgi:Kef-type K+ transport system membrane component KefB|nr:cation:proton antiporter [Bacteroidales bacterium]
MLTDYVILGLCVVVLLSYLFDITFKYSKIPGVVFLIALGIVLQVIVNHTGIEIPNMRPVLPVLGTLGLVFIVMEAGLEIRFEKNKTRRLMQGVGASVVLMVLFVSILTFAVMRIWHLPLAATLLNVIPLGIISSAVAISSSGLLSRDQREFITFESSASDIFGILLFDFIIYHHQSLSAGIIDFASKTLIIIPVAIIMAVAIAWLLYKMHYHVNHIAILTAVVMAYAIAELLHLPGLFLVVVFGLVLANNRFAQDTFINRLVDFNKFRNDIDSFKKILAELTFIVRSFFFIMFGFYVNLSGLVNVHSITVAAAITAFLFLLRWVFFLFFIRGSGKLVWFAPRGLITILLFMSLPDMFRIDVINEEVVTLVILMSIFVMMTGNIIPVRKKPADAAENTEPPAPSCDGTEEKTTVFSCR